MCGILVVKSKNITKNLKQKFISSIKFLKNRGPDETRIIQKNNFLIGFTRLSINDLKTASQPYESLCKRYIIVFDYDIYHQHMILIVMIILIFIL